MWSQKNHVTKRRFPNCFWFHPSVLQGPFTRWVNNKLKYNTSHFYLIFSITFRSTLLYSITQKCFEIMVAAILGKNLGPPMSKRSNDSISRKTKSCRQHASFLRPAKLMLWRSNKPVPPLNWNNPFSRTYWWLTDRHVDPEAKHTPI